MHLVGKVVTDHLFWQISLGDKVSLTSKYWWKNTGVLPKGSIMFVTSGKVTIQIGTENKVISVYNRYEGTYPCNHPYHGWRPLIGWLLMESSQVKYFLSKQATSIFVLKDILFNLTWISHGSFYGSYLCLVEYWFLGGNCAMIYYLQESF